MKWKRNGWLAPRRVLINYFIASSHFFHCCYCCCLCCIEVRTSDDSYSARPIPCIRPNASYDTLVLVSRFFHRHFLCAQQWQQQQRRRPEVYAKCMSNTGAWRGRRAGNRWIGAGATRAPSIRENCCYSCCCAMYGANREVAESAWAGLTMRVGNASDAEGNALSMFCYTHIGTYTRIRVYHICIWCYFNRVSTLALLRIDAIMNVSTICHIPDTICTK